MARNSRGSTKKARITTTPAATSYANKENDPPISNHNINISEVGENSPMDVDNAPPLPSHLGASDFPASTARPTPRPTHRPVPMPNVNTGAHLDYGDLTDVESDGECSTLFLDLWPR
jgi:hypothetical protein